MPKPDGGPVFPARKPESYMCKCGESKDFSGVQNPGMSLRDYFATHSESCGSYLSYALDAAKIMGIPEPNVDTWLPIERFNFWLKWEAFNRYAFADAMLAEREKGADDGK